MAERGSPSVRRRQLAAELRRLRERAGLTGDQAAVTLGWSPSKISRLETSQTGISADDLRKLIDLYQASDDQRAELQVLFKESSKTGPARAANPPAGVAAFVYAEAEAEISWAWEPQVIPGLLQTENYARQTQLGWQSMFRLPPHELDAAVATRLLRQQALTRDQPLKLTAVIDESVLRRCFGDATVMREQLDKLAELSELPHVSIQVLPLSGSHPIGTGTFVYMRFAPISKLQLPDIVFVEQLVGDYYIEDPAETNKFKVTFEQLRLAALDEDLSRDLIVATRRELWS